MANPKRRRLRTDDVENIQEVSDAQLVTRVARYDDVALAEIYRRHGGAVYGLARRVLNNGAEAEDVAQEVFLRLWNQPEKFDSSRGNLRSFLLTQSHARAVDVVRSHEARRGREIRDAGATARAGYDLQHEVWDLIMSEEVQRVLQELPDDERRAIEMAYFQGMTYVKVAEMLNEPEGTIKSRIRSGMRRMRALLAEYGVQGVES